MPAGTTVEAVQGSLIEMVRPACPQSVIRVSQVMARKPLFNNDEISAQTAIADTHELLAGYSDFVYFLTCQEAMDSDDRYFPIPAQWRKWAEEKAFLLNSFKEYFAA
ncbi:hypothetical protein [Spirosoma sp. KUDC1026]|uniref:hypothetical protein n=1 Tax=Spirosoma sp. KUDC1026 TaxID=2745947 RepID=UPI00159BCB0E|nr:hypothetical protein [Spirosoma sp. KUDC1026]QKZ15895.1 hypothetical protein HU175_24565 [Spirosoma sp. KUDC1026]